MPPKLVLVLSIGKPEVDKLTEGVIVDELLAVGIIVDVMLDVGKLVEELSCSVLLFS